MNNLDVSFAALTPIGLMLAGVLVLWYASARRRQSPHGVYGVALGLQVLGGVLLLGGVVAAVIMTTLYFAVLAVPIAVVVLIVFRRRYYEAEQQSLMWGLLTAAERGIPLDVAAQAFAEERKDVLGRRAAKLADYLEAGVPLGLALRRSGYRVDPAVSLAADLGYQTGTLGPALRQVVDRTNALEAATIPTASRLIYLGVTVVLTLIVQSFLMLKILPVMQKMHQEFELKLPIATQRILASSQLGTSESYVWVAFVTVGLLGLCFGILSLLGIPLHSLPVVRRLWWRVDSSLVMRWLATGVRQGRPILEMLRLLSGYFPQSAMRRGLARAAQRVEEGAHWCDSLLRVRLIRSRESAVFKAAERAGNLQWALDEMADSAVRRWAYKLQVWMSFAFPLVLIVLSCGVLAVLLAVLLPLLSLIQGMS